MGNGSSIVSSCSMFVFYSCGLLARIQSAPALCLLQLWFISQHSVSSCFMFVFYSCGLLASIQSAPALCLSSTVVVYQPGSNQLLLYVCLLKLWFISQHSVSSCSICLSSTLVVYQPGSSQLLLYMFVFYTCCLLARIQSALALYVCLLQLWFISQDPVSSCSMFVGNHAH